MKNNADIYTQFSPFTMCILQQFMCKEKYKLKRKGFLVQSVSR